MNRKILQAILFIATGLLLCSTEVYGGEARQVSPTIETEDFTQSSQIYDGNYSTYAIGGENPYISINYDEGVGSLYLEFDQIPLSWSLENLENGETVSCGDNGFLHEYVNVEILFGYLPQKLQLNFEKGTSIAEVYVFSEGSVPDWVQTWQPPCQQADLLLISTHSDDEQLFFAGVLPYYILERGMEVQVAYGVQHFEAYGVRNHQRPHEQLNGLWAVGVRNYPLMSDFPDLYAESKDPEIAFAQAQAVFENVGVTYDDFVDYITGCIRRFKPLVVVSHDLNGEYGHGAHVITANALVEALACSNDSNKYPESIEQYGLWQVEKTYLHLYEENPIVMDFDQPLEILGGKTPFQVTQDGFNCHESQHWTWFYNWIYGTSENPITEATQIQLYSPCYYGLYQSTVGLDVEGGDFFENIMTYGQRREAEEAAARAAEEAEALALIQAEEEAQEEARLAEEIRAAEEALAFIQAEEEAENQARAAEELIRINEKEAEEEASLLRKKVVVSLVISLSIIGIILFWALRGKKGKLDK